VRAPLDRKGLAYGVLAYGMWAIIPLFWKLLASVAPVEIIAHRAAWGFGVFVVIAAVAGKLGEVRVAMRDRRVVGAMLLSTTLLAVNWVTFVLAVNTGHVIDASLGYFINPLVSVALGTIVLRERLRRLQWVAVGLAAVGVAIATWGHGSFPWIAVVLAATFGAYGLVRKLAKVESLVGSTIETGFALPVAVAYLAILAGRGDGALGHAPLSIELLLVATGLVTAVPLVLFTSAARRLPLSTVGFLQYIGPSGQFLLAVLAFGEPLSHIRLVAFCWIWAALAVFSLDTWRSTRLA
jgi:chloramphenicol-sensitive protein RarD